MRGRSATSLSWPSTSIPERGQGSNEFRRFLDISVSSLYELAYILRLATDLGFAPPEDLERLESTRDLAGKLTWRLYEAIKQKSLA